VAKAISNTSSTNLWPYCWWVVPVLDHYSRRVLDFAVFRTQPSSAKVRRFLDRAIAKTGTAPKLLITESGVQFTSKEFRPWRNRHGIHHRKGAAGRRAAPQSSSGLFGA
jgi:transposase InsO family protein